MWHKIWDTASSFHERFIRPVWIRVHYNRLQEVGDDDGDIEEEIYINGGGGGDRSHITTQTATSQLARYGSISCINNKFNSTTFPDSLKHEEFDEVDAGFFRPTITFPVLELETTTVQNGDDSQFPSSDTTEFKKGSSLSSYSNSTTVTDLKHAIQFPSSKRPPYRHVQEEADHIEIISIDNSSSKRRDSDGDYKKFNNHLKLQQQNNQANNNSSSTNQQQNNVEEILQSSNAVVAKKSKSRRKKALKHMKKIAGWTWKSLKRGFYAAPMFIISPQPEASIYAMATKYKAYFG